MNRCSLCGESKIVAEILGVCLDCIREQPREAMPYTERAHTAVRSILGLPSKPPRSEGGIPCDICSNRCVIGEGERGYCGLRWNEGGKLRSLTTSEEGVFYAYLDPHVTNCCAAWFCPAGTGDGYPRYAYRDGPEWGYSNLAVFFYGCNFDCLFCQNPSHKNLGGLKPRSASMLAETVRRNRRISCICYFGGDPDPQLPFAIKASEMAVEARGDSPLRICFEWNGCGNSRLVYRAAELALETGGNVKFDLKCFTPSVSLALSGVSNRRAYENFRMIAERLYPERRGLPVLTATTLLVPGYVDAYEVEAIAEFIADLDASIPYSLLIFHPDYHMMDLPITPMRQVIECYRAAKRHLDRVHVGNLHLIGVGSMERFERIAMKAEL